MAGGVQFTFTLTGAQAQRAGYARGFKALRERVRDAQKAEAYIELAEMKARTPVKTGDLQADGRVVQQVFGSGFTVGWRFGGGRIDYAIYVHENLEAHHPVGQAKYVESVLAESRSHLARRVAARARAG